MSYRSDLKPEELVEAINATNPTIPVSNKKIRMHVRDARGDIVHKRGTINIPLYVTWLMKRYGRQDNIRSGYERQKMIQAEKNAAAVRSAQEIGDLPSVKNPERKERCRLNFKSFCEEYFPEVFYLPWSQDHLRAIEKIEKAVLGGDLFALAMARGTGKTVSCKMAVAWSAFYGHHQFISLIASSGEKAKDLLEGIKTWVETNPRFIEDFPEICYPIQKMERIATRLRGQKYHGVPTRVEWTTDRIILPTIEGSVASGIVIFTSGMKGSEIRGQQVTRADGSIARPSLVLIDDPQTTESAWSMSQCQRREQAIAGDILGMAGPGKKIAGLMTCTVIRPNDLADVILDRDKHPEWRGERFKLMYAFPKNESIWEEYDKIRRDELKNDGDGHLASEFYLENQEAMDEGAIPAWPERFNPDEYSAIQHAMNLKLRDEESFFAEYQNEPLAPDVENACLSIDEILEKTSGTPKGVVPEHSQYLTAFIDVQKEALFWMVCSWESNFTGHIVDYGAFPDQNRRHFSLKNLSETLSSRFPRAGLEGAIYAGLDELVNTLANKKWNGAIAGTSSSVNRIMIDANWGESTDVVYQFCRQSSHAGILLPSHGKFVGASSIPFSEYKRKKGDLVGYHWMIPNMTGKRAVRHVLIDTNYWKSFVHARLAVPIGDLGCLSLSGHDSSVHELLAEHLTSEYYIVTEAKERVVNEWKLKPGAYDNHWLDCLVGCAVGASIAGSQLASVNMRTHSISVPEKRVKFSDLQKRSWNNN